MVRLFCRDVQERCHPWLFQIDRGSDKTRNNDDQMVIGAQDLARLADPVSGKFQALTIIWECCTRVLSFLIKAAQTDSEREKTTNVLFFPVLPRVEGAPSIDMGWRISLPPLPEHQGTHSIGNNFTSVLLLPNSQPQDQVQKGHGKHL